MSQEQPENNQEPVPLRPSDASLSMQEVVQLNNDAVKGIAAHYNLPITNRAGTNKSVLIKYLIRSGWTPSDQVIGPVQPPNDSVLPLLPQVSAQAQNNSDNNAVDELINQIINNNSSNTQSNNQYGPNHGNNVTLEHHRCNPLAAQQITQDNGNHVGTTDQVCFFPSLSP